MQDILKSGDSNSKKALSIALGVFIGISPFWGFQTVLALFLAAVFKLNKAISFAFSNISIPPMIPLIIYASLKIGSYFYDSGIEFSFDRTPDMADIKLHIAQYLIGSFILAALSSAVLGLVGFALLALFTNREKK